MKKLYNKLLYMHYGFGGCEFEYIPRVFKKCKLFSPSLYRAYEMKDFARGYKKALSKIFRKEREE